MKNVNSFVTYVLEYKFIRRLPQMEEGWWKNVTNSINEKH